ncbi:MAG: TRC40/GET3/ArsA family transport-energizing ATPase [bacterium]
MFNTLRGFLITVRSIFIYRLMGERECAFCSSRRREQQGFLTEMDGKFADYNLIRMPLFPHEIRGTEALGEFAEILFGKTYRYHPAQWIESSFEISSSDSTNMTDLLEKDLQFILFGGKGGVGKTSMAAATSLTIAEQYPDKKILAFSTDPAHSLSDSFGFPVGSKVTPIQGTNNLYALEINAVRLLEDFKKEFRVDIEELFDKFLGGRMDIRFDREVMTGLMELSPTGLDEIMALKQLTKFIDERRFDHYILDNAATGHLIRFLELPGLVRDWLITLFKLLLKYNGVVKLTHTAEIMLDLAKNVRKIQETLMDPKRTEFVTVAIPEAMGTLEMERLLFALKKLKIPCRHIVMNMVIPSTQCDFCSSKRHEQQGYIQKTKMQFSDYLFTEIPLFPHEIKGTDRLGKFAEFIYPEQFMSQKVIKAQIGELE